MKPSDMLVDHTHVGAAFRRLSVPIGVQMLGDQLLGLVDTMAIGTLGTVALAGLTASMTVFFALMMFLYGLWNGLSIIAAQRIGANDVPGFARTVRSGGIIPGIVAIVLAVATFFGARPLLSAMIPHIGSADASAQYLVLRCFSFLPMNVSATAIIGLGAAGNRKLGIYLLGLINLVHIPLLLALALGWWTGHPYGIVGAGVSSLISEAIAAVAAVIYVWRKPAYRVFESLKIDWPLALRCARLGMPESVFEVALFAPDIVLVSLLAPLGAVVLSGLRALLVVSDLTFCVPIPMQAATQTVIGQRLGANDVEGAQSFLKSSMKFAFLITTATGIVVALLAWPLSYLFTLDARVATVAALPLALHMATMPIKGWAMVGLAPIRAAGDTKFSMAVGLSCAVLVLPLCWVCIEVLHIGLFGVPVAWIVAWGVRALLTQWRLNTKKWQRAEPLAA